MHDAPLHPTASDPFPPGNWPIACPGCYAVHFPVMAGWAAYREAVIEHRNECGMLAALLLSPSARVTAL